MTNDETDKTLDEILRAMGSNLSVYRKPHNREILDELRSAVRKVYAAGYNDCAKQFNVGVTIVPEKKVR